MEKVFCFWDTFRGDGLPGFNSNYNPVKKYLDTLLT